MFRFSALLAVVLAASLAFATGSDKPKETAPAEEAVFGKEYFPLKTNASYIYQSNLGDLYSYVQEDDDELTLSNESDEFSYFQTYIVKDDGVYLTRTKNVIDLFIYGDENIVTYNEPVPQLPFPLKAGDEWKWKGIETCEGETNEMYMSGKVIGLEEIVTEAGTYEALKLEFQNNSVGGSKSKMSMWLAKDIGTVRTEVELEGDGLAFLIQKLMGLDVIQFELVEIEKS